MELPSFYSIFLLNILRQGPDGKPINRKQPRATAAPMRLASGVFLLFFCFSAFASARIYPVTQLKNEIANFLATEYQEVAHERIDIHVGNLDKRLQLAFCATPVAFINQDQSGMGGNISVKAQCESGNVWSVHVPAQVAIYREIAVAGRDIGRGEVINHAHIDTHVVNISNIRQAFLAEAELILGREAKRNIGKGDVFRSSLLDAPTAIKRGELVTLESLAGSIKVSSSGTAMSDGRIGQKIRVRNNASERIISAVVVSQGLVQTL